MDLITEQKLERRARILDAARELIAERGYGGVTVRDLARRCRVSVPTLYNQFGGKDALLIEAVGAHFRELLAGIADGGEPAGHRRLLATVGRCADEMASLSDYHRALLRAFSKVPETRPLHETLAAELASALTGELLEMQRHRQLADWIVPGVLAAQITSACISTSVIWSQGTLGERGLRAFMVHAAAMLVLAGARGSARDEVERAAREAQDVLATAMVTPAPADDTNERSAAR